LARDVRSDKAAAHWKRLGLMPGAPECVIQAAHRAQIEIHHPDRGGDADSAKAINVAYDELKGRGTEANLYVAANYAGEPWAVLGISSTADAMLVSRAGKLLASELASNRRLAERVAWAVKHFAEARAAPLSKPRIGPMTPPPPRRVAQAPAPKPRPPASAGIPDGLVPNVDFGTLAWGDAATKTVQLTWKQFAPYEIKVEATGPVRVEITASKVLPGRFSLAFSVDWDAPEFSRNPTTRGYTLDADVTIRWAGASYAMIKAKGVVLYPAVVSASPPTLDLGAMTANQQARASLVLVSTSPVQVVFEPPAWLQRVDGAGKALNAPLKLDTNTPVRVEFRVVWPPIVERATASFAAGRPVRPTGKIVVRWNDRELTVPAEMVVRK
jgi:hypothetical protein